MNNSLLCRNAFRICFLLALSIWFVPDSSGQLSQYAECRRFARGTGSNPDFQSSVLPLQFENGVQLDNMGNNADKFGGIVPWFYRIHRDIAYHYSADTSDWTIKYENPITAFGSTAGGTPLFVAKSYSFAISAGANYDWAYSSSYSIVRISAYRKSDMVNGRQNVQPLDQTIISIPSPSLDPANLEFSRFAANGFEKMVEFHDLVTTIKPIDVTYGPAFGINSRTPFVITHRATSANFYYKIEMKGCVPLRNVSSVGTYPMVKPQTNISSNEQQENWSPLYTLNFDSQGPWKTAFCDRPQFHGQPIPPAYYGKSLTELQSLRPQITVSIPSSPDAYLSIDQSSELRQNPILDQFVSDMGNDPLLLANYVLNEVDLVNPLGIPLDGDVTTYSISPPGVSRSALGVFLEGQGSPLEQCALLVYFLRKAGTPAAFAFPAKDGLKVLDSNVSNMLGIQIAGLGGKDGRPPEPQAIPVNYPWVVAYIGGKWINLFPWLKDRQVIEGYDLYNYLPPEYNSGFKWMFNYASADPSILSLGDDTDSGADFFRKFLTKSLATTGVSIDDVGVKSALRKHYHSNWDAMPQPFSYEGNGIIKESLRLNPELFDTIKVALNARDPNTYQWLFLFATPELKICDVQNRRLLVRTVKTGPNQHKIELSLASSRPESTANGDYSSDPELIGRQVLTAQLPEPNGTPVEDISVTTIISRSAYLPQDYYPARQNDSPYGFSYSTYTRTDNYCKKGDLAAVCLNLGKVTSKMLDLQASAFQNEKAKIASDPCYVPDLDVIQGSIAYLLGLQYYKNTSDSNMALAALHKVSICSENGVGLARLDARRENGNLPNDGDIDPVIPVLDISSNSDSVIGNGTIHADSGDEPVSALQNFFMVSIAEDSSEEHRTINQMFSQTDAVSAVRLLQLSKQRGNLPVYIDIGSLDSLASQEYEGIPLSQTDKAIWNAVCQFISPPVFAEYMPFYYGGVFNFGLITPGAVSNQSGTYRGVGALVVGPYGQAALLGSNLALAPQNQGGAPGQGSSPTGGGNGDSIPKNSLGSENAKNVDLPKTSDGNYKLSLNGNLEPALPATPQDFLKYENQLRDGTITPDPTTLQSLDAAKIGLNIGTGSDSNADNADAFRSLNERGTQTDSSFKNPTNFVSDPVNITSGEFYIDSVDLKLNGPMPLELRRNYGSKVLHCDSIGFGWKTNNIPYLTIAADGEKIYAADDDGAVIAFVKQSETQWIPKADANPEMCNTRGGRVGGLSNVFNSKIDLFIENNQQIYLLTKSDGSMLKFKVMTFAFPESSGLVRTRPYLVRKTDNKGNYFDFSYGTDASQSDFSQVRRIQSSNGNFIGFYYDAYGRIIQGYTGDGRCVYYGYDSFGDLTSVTLPDGSIVKYEYQHDSYIVSGISRPYSRHLLIRETKPENNVLENSFDSQRRVTEQRSIVQSGTSIPVRSAKFDYHWTSEPGSPVAGYTTVTDAYNRTTRYDVSDGQITQITDPLSQTIQQDWYAVDDTSPGAYPRSIKRSIDKRGQIKNFTYDANGNISTCSVTGDITGAGTTDTVTITNHYIAGNRIWKTIDDSTGIQTEYFYEDPHCLFLVTKIEKTKNGVIISSSKVDYESVVSLPLESHGLMKRLTRAPGSADESITEWTNSAKGLITSRTDFTGTNDPDVSHVLEYNLRNELVEDKDALGRKVNYAYDNMGRRIWVELHDETGSLVSWNYNYYDGNGNLTWSDGPRYNPEDYVWRKYDGASRKTEEVRWRSRAKADGSGVEAEFGDDLYASTIYSYDLFGNVTDIANPLRNIVHMDYDAIGQMRARTAYKGDLQTGTAIASEGFEYEPGGNVSVYTSPLGGVTRKYYTTAGALKRQENPDQSVLEWRYDLSGRMVRQILSNHSYWQTDYDDINRTVTRTLFSESGTVLARTSEKRDLRGNVISTQNAEGFIFQTTFDGLDRPKTITGPAADANSGQQITTYIYDNCGQELIVVNSKGEKTTTIFDAVKRPVSITVSSAGGGIVSQTSYGYSADGQSITTTNGSGPGAISTTVFTNTSGTPVLTKNADNTFTRSAYDSVGNLLSFTDELGRPTSYTYNALNRLETTTLPDGATTTCYYDPAGNLTQRIMPGNLVWSGTHDSIGRPTAEWLQQGSNITRQFGYTYYNTGPYIGLAQNVTDGRGVTATKTYDDYLRLATVDFTGPLPEQNGSASYSYDNRNLLKQISQSSVNNANGPPTRVERDYDGYGKITGERVYIDGNISSDLSQKWDTAGRRSSLEKGSLVAAQGSGAGDSISFGYEANGLLGNVTAGSASSTFHYGDNGLLISRQNDWRTLNVDHRNARGRLVQQSQIVGGMQALQETLDWQADSRLSSYTANRQGSNAWNESINYGYNSRGALISEGYSPASGSNGSLAYEFDFGASGGLGVRTQALTNGKWSDGLDVPGAFGRAGKETKSTASLAWTANGTATGAASVTLTMDGIPLSEVGFDAANGNWITALSLSPGRHQLIATGYTADRTQSSTATSNFTVSGTSAGLTGTTTSITPEYDAVGNVITRTLSDSRVQTLKWDALGRLVSVTQRDASQNGYNWHSIYDGLGRRLRTMCTPVAAGTADTLVTQTIQSWYDPQVEFLEIAVVVNGERTWKIYGPDLNGIYGGQQGTGGLEMSIHESDGAVIGYINDAFGNIVASSGSNGDMVWNSTKTGGYGPLPGSTPEYLSNSVSLGRATAWRGKRMDETGFYYLGARYYEPEGGRFLSSDPLGHAVSMSLYDYCNGDPVNGLDPDGRCIKQAVDWVENTALGMFQAQANYETEKVTAQVQQMTTDYNYYGSWSGVEAANSNPIYSILANGYQAYTGLGIYPSNSGQPVDGLERFLSGAVAVGDLSMLALSIAISTASEGSPGLTQRTVAAKTAPSFFEGASYTPKVLQQMKGGIGEFHSFPESVTGFESAGTVRTITGGDGAIRQVLEIPGSYGSGGNGVFQFMKNADGTINHRLFVPNSP